MESFFSAVHNFTVVPIHRAASKPIDSSTLAWLPVIGILSALLGISFYLPLATLYLPLDVAVVPGLAAICWLRGFKPEIDFCQLCDLLFGYRKHFTTRPILGVPGAACLFLGILLKYAILRQFYLLESVRLLTFGTIVSFTAPLFRPTQEHRWLTILGVIWLTATSIAVFSGSKASSLPDLTTGFPRSGISLRVDLSLCEVNFLFCRKSGPAQRGIISGRISRVPRVPDCPVSLYLVASG